MNDEDLLRYSRQILLPAIDLEGQEKICAGKILIVGMGGLGSPVALYLAAAGVGRLWLADNDQVELSNLQRQIIHKQSALGEAKTYSAQDTLAEINNATEVMPITERLSGDVLNATVEKVDVVVDCSDNFATRFALNQACFHYRKPLVSGAAIRLEGQVSVFDFRQQQSPCYRCLYDDQQVDDTSCAQNGVLASLVGVIGTIQATEVLKILAGFGEPLVGRLLLVDAYAMTFRELKLAKDRTCPVCAEG